jgi:predicted enzyme related to lactoylglutathione lyase
MPELSQTPRATLCHSRDVTPAEKDGERGKLTRIRSHRIRRHAMRVLGISWLGTRTEDFGAMVRFFKETMGMIPDIDEEGFAVFRLPDGDVVELFPVDDPYHRHFQTGPVAGFRVEDVAAAQAEMEAAGVEFFGPPEYSDDGYAWSHFRAPDGTVFELMSRPPHVGN